MTQQIRRSQFIITWGPGAILEGTNGPRIIPMPDIGIFGKPVGSVQLSPDRYQIPEQRMSEGLLNRAMIFRLPSNSELNIHDNIPLYDTKPFPEWSICIKHEILYRSSQNCPKCPADRFRGSRSNMEAIRFVCACENGHLDDIDWEYMVHETGDKCGHSDWFEWTGEGRSIGQIYIRCPKCHKSTNLGRAWNRELPCSGRFPERELLTEHTDTKVRERRCDKKMKIIQRQASNIRIPEIVTLFTIPPRDTVLHRMLQSSGICDVLFSTPKPPASQKDFNDILKNLSSRGRIEEATCDKIMSYPWNETLSAIKDIQQPVLPTGIGETNRLDSLLRDEFHALITASLHGAPPENNSGRNTGSFFVVDRDNVRKVSGPSGRKYRVVPVSCLNTLIVQKGYKRMSPDSGTTVDIAFTDKKDNRWYPGVEFRGEGIFLMLDSDDGMNLPLRGENHKKWDAVFSKSGKTYEEQIYLFRNQGLRYELHPVFVWWHSLAHILIRLLSVDSGYSAASIRERIYFEMVDDHVRAGIILYAVQPGEDGTLGGLVSLVQHAETLLRDAATYSSMCSNDPLCDETTFRPGYYSGASCYGCLLLSETSCEHRNMWLDRHLIMENPP